MFEFLSSIDQYAFLFLNNLHHEYVDPVMFWISNKWVWIPLYIWLLVLVYKKYSEFILEILIFIALIIVASDQLSVWIKDVVVMRPRPCNDPSLTGDIHLVYGICGGDYGFVSSHAANTFALFSFLSFLFKDKINWVKWVLFFYAFINCYSRVYLGVHYPGDVICGGILGYLLGKFAALIMRLYFPYIKPPQFME